LKHEETRYMKTTASPAEPTLQQQTHHNRNVIGNR
jgi:hypothetical protein